MLETIKNAGLLLFYLTSTVFGLMLSLVIFSCFMRFLDWFFDRLIEVKNRMRGSIKK